MRIIVTGPKGSGKSTVGRLLAQRLDVEFFDTDQLIEQIAAASGQAGTFREIYRRLGREKFAALERQAVERLSRRDWCVMATGGSTLMDPSSRRILRPNSVLCLLAADAKTLYARATLRGMPAYLENESNPQAAFDQRVQRMLDVLAPYADIVLDTADASAADVADRLRTELAAELAIRQASPNTLGELIRVTTFGESHGPAYGAILDGMPAGVPISVEQIQAELDRRRPGQSAVSTPRSEADRAQILSGIFEGKTTGTPIGLLILNRDQDSARYDYLREVFRPGHADFTFFSKFGLRDHRGGGRSSGRETSMRVACGAIAKQFLAGHGVRIVAHAVEIAGIAATKTDYAAIESNPVRCADPAAAEKMVAAILAARASGDSVGGIVKLEVLHLPPGLGDPVFGKLDARLGAAILSIGAVKGVEFGTGFAAAKMRGSQHNDQAADGAFLSNNAGGILGGISTGQDVILRAVVKPTASVASKQKAVTTAGQTIDLSVQGRHDPCIVPHVIPVIENMAALVLMDCWLIQQSLCPGWPENARTLPSPERD